MAFSVIARSILFCHCEERSDAAIMSLRGDAVPVAIPSFVIARPSGRGDLTLVLHLHQCKIASAAPRNDKRG